MAKHADRDPEDSSPDVPGTAGETFKREGPQPPTESTGGTVEEMNEAARESVLRNVRPEGDEDRAVDDEALKETLGRDPDDDGSGSR